jgi:hypothetical protein
METGNIVPADIPLTQQPVMDPLCKELFEVLIDDSNITVVKFLWTLLSLSAHDTESVIILGSNTHLSVACTVQDMLYSLYWNVLDYPHSAEALNCLTSLCLVLRKCSGLYIPVILRCQSYDGAVDGLFSFTQNNHKIGIN